MVIGGIDPSYSRTGVAVVKDGKLIAYTSISVSEKSVYDISECLFLADRLAAAIIKFFREYHVDEFIIEYPVLATRSGAYLGLIQQALFSKWTADVYMAPSQAINSFTRCKGKKQLVEWTKRKHDLLQKINHDEASAAILADILIAYKKGEYKNTIKHLRQM